MSEPGHPYYNDTVDDEGESSEAVDRLVDFMGMMLLSHPTWKTKELKQYMKWHHPDWLQRLDVTDADLEEYCEDAKGLT